MNALYYCNIRELQSFCNSLMLSIHIHDTNQRIVKLDNKNGLTSKIYNLVKHNEQIDSIYHDWAVSNDSNLVTIQNFKSTDKTILTFMGRGFKFGNKSFRLADELWRKTTPITWEQFRSLYYSYEYTPHELRYNNSEKSTWYATRDKNYNYAKKVILDYFTHRNLL